MNPKTNLDEEYLVEKVIGKRVKDGLIEYRVKWEGYPLSECTWEPVSNLSSIQKLLDAFDNKQSRLKAKNKKKTQFVVTQDKDKDKDKAKDNYINTYTYTNQLSGLFKNADGNLSKITLTGIKNVKQTKEGLCAIVYYEENGVVKKGTFPTSELRLRAPELLIDFYEAQIKFI